MGLVGVVVGHAVKFQEQRVVKVVVCHRAFGRVRGCAAGASLDHIDIEERPHTVLEIPFLFRRKGFVQPEVYAVSHHNDNG